MADASSTVLREYLIKLGFQVDKKEAKQFDDSLVRWNKNAAILGKTLGATAGAAVTMVGVFAYQMEKLYYASRRAESTAGNLQALDFASRQVGVKNITQSVETLARNLRSNPGLTGLLESLGVPVKGRDKSDVLMDLVTQLKKMPFFIAERYANLFGIDPDTLYMLQDGLEQWKAANEQRKQWAQEWGVDTEAAAKAGKDMMNQWGILTEQIGLFRDVLVIAMLPAMKEFVTYTGQVLRDWTEILNAKPQEGSVMDRIGVGLGVKDAGGGVVLSKESQQRLGQNETDQDVTVVIGEDGKPKPVKKKFLDKMYDRFMEWGGAKKYRRPEADQESVDAAMGDIRERPNAPKTKAAIDQEIRKRYETGEGLNTGGYTPPSARQGERLASPGRPTGASDQAMAFFISKGWTKQQAAGIVANLKKESEFDHQAVGDGGKAYGIAQWHPDRQEDFKKWSGKDIRQSNYEEQLAFIHYELTEGKEQRAGESLRRASTARQAGATVSDLYERPKASEGAERGATAERYAAGYGAGGSTVMGALASGPMTMNLNQKTEVTVNGSNDPERTGREVGREVDQANSDLVRNLRVKVQ